MPSLRHRTVNGGRRGMSKQSAAEARTTEAHTVALQLANPGASGNYTTMNGELAAAASVCYFARHHREPNHARPASGRHGHTTCHFWSPCWPCRPRPCSPAATASRNARAKSIMLCEHRVHKQFSRFYPLPKLDEPTPLPSPWSFFTLP